jgi:hypothetical protein
MCTIDPAASGLACSAAHAAHVSRQHAEHQLEPAGFDIYLIKRILALAKILLYL